MARQTVAICEAGHYINRSGARINIAAELDAAKSGTKLYSLESIATISPPKHHQTHIEVRNETTFQALARLAPKTTGHLACLNFASAKNPGGGFLNGAIAQEEALAAASGLYPCLLRQPEYYERNRAHRSALYLDLAIYSPLVPFIRDDSGALLAKPVLASVITAPAPNAGAIANNEPGNLSKVRPALERRAELVLGVAVVEKVDHLVLGAWGCGVFRNDPELVAHTFKNLLGEKYSGAFTNVAFAVFDRSPTQGTHRAFASAFNAVPA